jgi:hypothetical protein
MCLGSDALLRRQHAAKPVCLLPVHAARIVIFEQALEPAVTKPADYRHIL